MGCINSKASAVEDSQESPRERLGGSKGSSELRVPRVSSSKREDGARVKDKLGSGDIKIMLIDKNVNASMRLYNDEIERRKKKAENFEVSNGNHPGSGRIPKATVGEQVAAGWPAWLSAVAGEAINGWVPLCAENFEKIDKIGQGTYSNVFKARDAINNKIVALKKVRFDYLDAESVKFMAREIIILRRLNHPNVIKLEGLVTSRTSSRLYLVFEYMEHDLTGLASRPGLKFTESQVKCYLQQLLNGLDHCHSHGVLHRDIKGSNLLIDNNGILKIADFGLASFFDSQHGVPMTSRVVTLWYRPPELLLGACHYGVAVDLWSAGCILGELYAGKPILPGKTEVEQLHKIFRLCGSPSEDYWRNSKLPHSTVFKPLHPYKRCVAETFRQIPAPTVALLETLLAVDPADRGTAALALKSEFFTTNPLACDPSSLPKYPPSKELDVKLLEEESRRRGAGEGRGQRVDQEGRGPKDSQAIPVPNAGAGLGMLVQRRRDHASSTNRGEMFNSYRDGGNSGYVIDNPERAVKDSSMEHQQNRKISHSGPLVQGTGWAKSRKEHDDLAMVAARSNLSSFSSLVASRRTSVRDDCQEIPGPSQPHTANQVGWSQRSFNGLESTRKQDGKHNTQRISESLLIGGGKTSVQGPMLHGRGSKGNKIYVSGPLLGPSNNVDQMLKEHDRKIQEYSRRARLDKARHEKVQIEGKQVVADRTFISRGAG